MLNRWSDLEGPVPPWARIFNKIMNIVELPSLMGSLIYITSDYGGLQKESQYVTISILFSDIAASKNWFELSKEIRQRILLDSRKMSFKSLNDNRRRSALAPFLEAANEIEGVLFCFAIHKKIENQIDTMGSISDWKSTIEIKADWKEQEFNKMLRVSSFVSMLTGGLSKPHQNIYWISDEDSIFANETMHMDVAQILSRLGNLYIKPELSTVGVGTTNIDPGDRIEEDLVAIPDLTAGAIAEILRNLSKHPNWSNHPCEFLLPGNLNSKTEIIGAWLSQIANKLKRVIVVFEPYGSNFRIRLMKLQKLKTAI